MASVTFDASVGGDGSTVDDTAGPNGLKNNGHRTRFVPALSQTVAVASFTKTKAEEAAASASSALNAPGTQATCNDSIAIPTVFPTNVAFTLDQVGKLFAEGQTLVFADDADAEKQFIGVLVAFVSATGVGTLRVRQSAGTGTLADWIVSLSTPLDATLTGRVSALETNLAAIADDRLFYYGDFS